MSEAELTASIKAAGDGIRELKAAKADKEQIMAKVAEMNDLKKKFEEVTGKPFDPPKEKKDKKKGGGGGGGGGGGKEKEGPSKNEEKKAAKAAKKAAAKAAHKSGAPPAAAPAAAAAAQTPAASKALPPPPPATKIHRSVTAISDVPPSAGGGTGSATLHYHPTAAPVVTAVALSLAPPAAGAVTLAPSQNEGLARLVLPTGAQLMGDHSIARYLAATTLAATNEFQRAQIEQWMDLALLYVADEAPFLTLLEGALASTTYLGGTDSFSLADAAVAGAFQTYSVVPDAATMPNIARWYAMCSKEPVLAAAANLLASAGKGGKGAAAGPGGDDGASCPDLEGAVEGEVVTRFPPEPSGYLHIGHAKAVLLNEYYARRYKGKLLLRFDDTNPDKEKGEFEDNIRADLAALGVKPDIQSHSSDHFEKCQQLARKMIKDNLAFMDDSDKATIKQEREDRVNSKHHDQPVETAMDLFEKMLKGEADEWCLRAKIDMTSDNGTLRDPVLYRANSTPHHKTGTKYKAYPTYDFVCPIVDSIEGVTHALRTTEYNDRDAQYAWLQEAMGLRKVIVHAFSRLNFVYTLLSKRKLQWFVDKGIVPGWDDPRFPTVQGIVRRGVSFSALRKFIYMQGASRNVVLQEWDKFWAINKDEYDPVSPRFMGIAQKNAAKLTVTNIDNDGCAASAKVVDVHPGNPEMGKRPLRLGPSVLLEAEDAATCEVGDKIILLMWGVHEITKKNADGSLESTYLPDASVKKLKKKFNWVLDDGHLVHTDFKEYGDLITKPKLDPDDNFEDFLKPIDETFAKMPAFCEPGTRSLKYGDVIQLVRRGFFRVDKPYGGSEASPLELVLIPDGKKTAMSTLSTALAHK